MTTTGSKLLSITRVAKILGAHPLTLRSWAEKGYIPHYKTPGGHRRFKERDLEAFLSEMNQSGATPTPESLAHQAIQREISAPSARKAMMAQPVRQIEISREQRNRMRSTGQQMLELAIQYTSGNATELALEQARAIGLSYGKFSRQNELSLSETVAAFNFFRDTIVEAIFDPAANATDLDVSNPQLYHRLNHFFNDALLATIQAAEEKTK
ncbi:MAG TPA: excisionase family DNA-binding protein [Chloroflexi bacterium]|nr:excisionase family DNA-binding protein [Chloroflexota bacterium]